MQQLWRTAVPNTSWHAHKLLASASDWDVGVELGPVRHVHVQQGQLLRGASCCCGVGLLDLLQQVVREAAASALQQLPLLLLKHKLLCLLLLLLLLLLFAGLLLLVQAMQPC
jgi:hypothetical protein